MGDARKHDYVKTDRKTLLASRAKDRLEGEKALARSREACRVANRENPPSRQVLRHPAPRYRRTPQGPWERTN